MRRSLLTLMILAACGAMSSTLLAAEQGPAVVRFISPDGALSVQVDGAGPAVKIARGGSHSFKVRGKSLRYTVSRGEVWRYTADVDLHRIRARTITLTIPGMHVRVVNRTDEDRLLSVHGRNFGIIKRNRTRLIGPLSPDAELLDSTGVRSRTHVVRRFSGSPGGQLTLVLPPLPAGLLVPNPLPARAQLSIDHRDYGALGPGEEIYILGLAPGSHEVELIEAGTGRPFRYDAEMVERGAAAPKAGAIKLRVVNHTGETLVLPPALGGFFPRRVEPDESVVMTVPLKPFKLRLAGRDSELTYAYDIKPGGGVTQRWRIERPRGQLHLTNGTGEVATVAIGAFGSVRMAADSKVQVRNVPAGKLDLAITTASGGDRFTRKLTLKPGGDARWTVTRGGASLHIKNLWQEPVDLAIDGSPRGRVNPAGLFRVKRIQPGTHEVVAQTIVSKVREVISVTVVDGEKTTVKLRPPQASLRLQNRGDRALEVVVRGVRVGVVEPGKTSTFNVRSGRMAVDVSQRGTSVSTTWFGTAAPAQQLDLPNPTAGSAPLIVRNPLHAPVSVRVGSREPVKVAAGAELTISDLGAGIHLVEITGDGFRQRQRVHVAPGLPPVTIRLVTELLK